MDGFLSSDDKKSINCSFIELHYGTWRNWNGNIATLCFLSRWTSTKIGTTIFLSSVFNGKRFPHISTCCTFINYCFRNVLKNESWIFEKYYSIYEIFTEFWFGAFHSSLRFSELGILQYKENSFPIWYKAFLFRSMKGLWRLIAAVKKSQSWTKNKI